MPVYEFLIQYLHVLHCTFVPYIIIFRPYSLLFFLVPTSNGEWAFGIPLHQFLGLGLFFW